MIFKIIVFLFSSLLTLYSTYGVDSQKPNFLIFMTDDQSYWHTSFNGDPVVKTPNFDRVAREGINFVHCFCNAPSCTPSRGAFLTGRNIYELEEASVLQGAFPAKFPTFQELLWKAGYHCGYTGKAWGPGIWNATGRKLNPGGIPYKSKYEKQPDKGLSTENYTESFRKFLKDRKSNQPFSFIAGASEPHSPLKPGIGVENGLDPEKVFVPKFLPDTLGIRSHICDYLYEIQWADQHLGNMIQLLDDNDLLKNTVIIVTSDNGMSFPAAKGNLYDQGTRVPLAIRFPKKIPSGRIVHDFITLADLHPTICSLAGIQSGRGVVKSSIEKILYSHKSGRINPSRNFVVTAFEVHTIPYPMRAIRTDQYLYIKNYEYERMKVPPVWEKPERPSSRFLNDSTKMCSFGYVSRHRSEPTVRFFAEKAFGFRPEEEIYNIVKDPYALNNLASNPKFDEIKRTLDERLTEYLTTTNDPRHTNESVEFQNYPLYGSPNFKSSNATLLKQLKNEERLLNKKFKTESMH